MYRLPRLRGGDMGDRFAQGTWLGKNVLTDAHLIDRDGVITMSEEVRLLPIPASWDLDKSMAVKEYPWRVQQRRDKDEKPDEEDAQDGGEVETILALRLGEPIPDVGSLGEGRHHGVHITKADLEDFDYTKNCRKCMLIRADMVDVPNFVKIEHTKECRQRITDCMRTRGSARQKKRVARAERRLDDHLARLIEEQDMAEKRQPMTDQATEENPKSHKRRSVNKRTQQQ